MEIKSLLKENKFCIFDMDICAICGISYISIYNIQKEEIKNYFIPFKSYYK
jgi:hypothetical protein